MKRILSIVLIAFIITSAENADACTNLLVTKGATTDGSSMLTYTADAGGFMAPLYFHAGGKHNDNDSIEIYDGDSNWSKYLGKIKQVKETYRVIGHINEWQLSITETTFGGRTELRDTTGILDYSSLMNLALQRAKTARAGIKVITDLVAEYGYYSSGESISLVDPNEAWILEIIGKGKAEKGAVWVAKRVPDGHIAVHANKARIRNITNDKDECMYSPDVMSFAEKMGYFDAKKGIMFSFSDCYDPATPSGLFACEGRVWSIYRRAAKSMNLSSDYFTAVKGVEAYPFSIKPDSKLSLKDVYKLMRDHFEDTEFDMTKSLAAGPYGCPYRWKPLGFKIDGDTTEYAWERPISTQQTAYSLVSQMRSNLPREIGGVLWFGFDDTYSTVYTPFYCSITKVPEIFTDANVSKFSLNSACWMFNLVSNIAYQKYSYAIKDIQEVQDKLEDKYIAYQAVTERAAQDLLKNNRDLAIEYLTEYSNAQAQNTMVAWTELWDKLVVKYNDGYVNDVNIGAGRAPKGVGYGNEFFKQVVKEKPGYYEMKWRTPKAKK